MSKLTGKTYVRMPLDEAKVLKDLLLELKNLREFVCNAELVAFRNFWAACEEAEKREKKKQDLADEMGEGTWSLK